MIDATGCTITLFTQDRCTASAASRAWLSEQGIGFTERNVSADPDSAEALARTGIFATPLITICTHKVFGFRPEIFARTIEACEFREVA